MTEVSTKYTQERYSKEDFLAISPEYNTDKEEVFLKYKKKIKLSYICMGISSGLLFLFIILFFFNPVVFGMFAVIMIILGIVSGVFASINTAKREKALSDLGDKYYRDYVSNLYSNEKQ